MKKSKEDWLKFIDHSFLNDSFKNAYKVLIDERFVRINL